MRYFFKLAVPSTEGSLRHIELRRGGATVTDFDLYSLLIGGDKSKDVKLLDGDVIYIAPVSSQVAVVGSVHTPGIYELRAGETLDNLLHDAGGASSLVSNARVSVERLDDHHDRHAMEVAYDAAGYFRHYSRGRGSHSRSIHHALPIKRPDSARQHRESGVALPGVRSMRISELIPDKNSLLSAQLLVAAHAARIAGAGI